MKTITGPSDYKVLGYTEPDVKAHEQRVLIEANIIDMKKYQRKKFAEYIVKNSKSF